MKELSIAEKAKRYDEAVETAKSKILSADKPCFVDIKEIFPELIENEDEMIRKELIEFLVGKRIISNDLEGINVDKTLIWLEKQGEQKPVDKAEPKFNDGDWIVSEDGKTWLINGIDSKNYQVISIDGEHSYFLIIKQSSMHLWSIADAKGGDALVASDGSIFLFAGVANCDCKYYAVLASDNTVQINKDVEGCYWEASIAVHPATKEQCDILMKAIDDAGYTFNFELKKIVQKPMGEPIFKIGDTLRRKGKDYTFIVDRIQGGYYHCDHNNGAFFPIEEQDEWELVDKVEPKFHEGEWGIDEEDGTIFQIVKVLNNTYTYRTNEGGEYSCTHYSLENDARHWTIKDAKNGDILHSVGFHSDCVFIFNGLDIWKSDKPDRDREVATGYCGLFASSDKMEFGVQGPDCVEVNTIKPATKVQRDLLFQKMKEAGYEWDSEHKQLKKIGPKSATMSLDEAIEHCKEKSCGSDACALEHKQLEKWLTELKELKEQNPTWSKEDEVGFGDAMWAIEQARAIAKDENDMGNLWYAEKWLKSVKDKVQPQLKQEWSEEDEEMFNAIIADIQFTLEAHIHEVDQVVYEREIDWLKSLKDRYSWTPSEEQIEAFEHFVRSIGESGYASPYDNNTKLLHSLLSDLKKLNVD